VSSYLCVQSGVVPYARITSTRALEPFTYDFFIMLHLCFVKSYALKYNGSNPANRPAFKLAPCRTFGLQQPAVDELIIRSPVILRVGLVERLERPGNPACHLKCLFRRADGYVPVFDGTIILLPHIT